MKYYGADRVIEPKGALPATAWQVDNSGAVGSREIRIAVSLINLEITNFDQICSSCEYDEARIKAHILQIINQRGKLHNPYTKTGGLLFGTIEEASDDFPMGGMKVGDRIICMSPLTGIPIQLDSIESVDFQYGQISCSGYAICFESNQLVKWNGKTDLRYLLKLLDEEGNLLGVKSAFESKMVSKIAILSSDMVLLMIYAKMVRHHLGDNVSVAAVIDKAQAKKITKSEFNNVFSPLADEVHFVTMNRPVESFAAIAGDDSSKCADFVINLDDTEGSECVASLLVRDKGTICYMSFKNNYSEGSLVADSLGKEVSSYSTCGYESNVYEYALLLAETLTPHLKRLDNYYESRKLKPVSGAKKIRTQMAAQKIDDFIYSSPATADMIEKVLNIARYDCNVVIQGETGTGKEKVFNLIHHNSPRKGKPCIRINCATIPENLAESEFFGYEGGAFTGAQKDGKEGYFELADNGTLFLDEIGALSLTMQSKLLRVLQENTFYRLGGTEPIKTNVRVICANNVPLKKLVEEGRFREDLYYRLNICLIEVPPLRERVEDIRCLSAVFVKSYSKKYGIDRVFSPEAQQKLVEYYWPGNVRELENVVHRLYIAQRNDIIEADDVDEILNEDVYDKIMVNVRKQFKRDERIDFTVLMEEQEKKIITYALQKEKTTRKAAEFLNLPQTTFVRKKNKYSI